MNDDSEVNGNKKKEVMQRIKRKDLKSRYSLSDITCRKMSVNGSLTSLNKKEAEGKIISTYTKIKSIEEKIINHNKNTLQ